MNPIRCLLLAVLLSTVHPLRAQPVFLSGWKNDLYRFYPATCRTEFVCHLKIEPFYDYGIVYDIALHPDGQLYALEDRGRLFKVDTSTGDLTLEREFERKGLWNALHIDTAGVFYLARQTELPQQGDLWIYIPADQYVLNRGVLRRPSGDLCKFGFFLVMAGTAGQISDVSSQNNLTHSSLLNYDADEPLEALFPYEDSCRGTLLMGIGYNGTTYRLDLHKKENKRLCQLPIRITGAAASPWAGLEPRRPLTAQAVEPKAAFCETASGALKIRAAGGRPPYSYSLNDKALQNDSLFKSLPAAFYRVAARDALGCLASDTITLTKNRSFSITKPLTTPAACTAATGTVLLSVEPTGSASGPVSYVLDGGAPTGSGFFTSIRAGPHVATALDSAGCKVSLELTVPADCPVFIPNIFAPDASGNNAVFRVSTGSFSPVHIRLYRIYDRWGALVFESRDFPADSADDFWWTGACRGKPCPTGVYLYQLEIVLPDGAAAQFSGGVTLLR